MHAAIRTVLFIAILSSTLHAAPTGINLSGIRDWSTAWPFVDCFKTARAWISHSADQSTWDDGRQVQLTPEGWVSELLPNQHAGTLLFRSTGPHYPAGRYVCLYEGSGEIRFRFDATIVAQQPCRIELDVTPSNNGIHLTIAQTDPADPIRNIRVIMPGFEDTYESQIFHPAFLESLEGFDTIRFMDWMDTNNSPTSTWEERAKLSDASWALGHGVPIEIMAELCNRLDANAWFCMPHLADDNYIQKFAKQASALLEPERRVYIEHSNEVWNGIFSQHQHARDQAQARSIPGDPFQAALRYHAERSVEIFQIWSSVFVQDRLVRVLAGQHANPWAGLQIMDWQNAHEHADSYATAPYFGGDLGGNPDTQNMSVQQILQFCRDDIINNQRPTTAQNKANASARGLDLIAYEAGQHLVVHGANSNNQQVIDRFIEANRDQDMQQLYRIYIEGWEAAGGGVFCIFSHITTPNRYGSWGIWEYQQQPIDDAPKAKAVLEHIDGISCIGDFNIDAQLDFFDISAFLTAFADQDPAADLAPPIGSWNFFDVSTFLNSFINGCEMASEHT